MAQQVAQTGTEGVDRGMDRALDQNLARSVTQAERADPTGEGAHAHEALAHGTKVRDHTLHEEGTMDVSSQERTFATFMRFATRMALVILAILVFLALVNG